VGGQAKYNLVGRTPELGSWNTPATIVECVVAVKNHKESSGHAGEQSREGPLTEEVRASRNSTFIRHEVAPSLPWE
jgi:hypothetical protein